MNERRQTISAAARKQLGTVLPLEQRVYVRRRTKESVRQLAKRLGFEDAVDDLGRVSTEFKDFNDNVVRLQEVVPPTAQRNPRTFPSLVKIFNRDSFQTELTQEHARVLWPLLRRFAQTGLL